jgi:excisionase family DNA binding protein
MGKKLNVSELEADSGISRFTWRTKLRQGVLPFFKVGRRVLVDEEDYKSFMASTRIPARSAR